MAKRKEKKGQAKTPPPQPQPKTTNKTAVIADTTGNEDDYLRPYSSIMNARNNSRATNNGKGNATTAKGAPATFPPYPPSPFPPPPFMYPPPPPYFVPHPFPHPYPPYPGVIPAPVPANDNANANAPSTTEKTAPAKENKKKTPVKKAAITIKTARANAVAAAAAAAATTMKGRGKDRLSHIPIDNQVVFYAVRSGDLLEKPVIFFGWEDMKDFFAFQEKKREEEGVSNNSEEEDNDDDNNDDNGSDDDSDTNNKKRKAKDDNNKKNKLEFKVFYNLLQAYYYLNPQAGKDNDKVALARPAKRFKTTNNSSSDSSPVTGKRKNYLDPATVPAHAGPPAGTASITTTVAAISTMEDPPDIAPIPTDDATTTKMTLTAYAKTRKTKTATAKGIPTMNDTNDSLLAKYSSTEGSVMSPEAPPLSFTAKLDALTPEERWEFHFDLLKQFKEETGSCEVPTIAVRLDKKYRPLRPWLAEQAEELRTYDEYHDTKDDTMLLPSTVLASPPKQMTPERRQRLLSDIGITKPKSWQDMFSLLQEFKDDYGDLPAVGDKLTTKYKSLLGWQRQQQDLLREYDDYINSNGISDAEPPTLVSSSNERLTVERRQQLLELGVVKTQGWDDMYDLLVEYKNEFGSCNVPSKTDQVPRRYKNLRFWVQVQRRMIREFEAMHQQQQQQYNPFSEDEEAPLPPITTTKVAFAHTPNRGEKWKITAEQRQRLLDLGFVREVKKSGLLGKPKRPWEDMFALLKEFKDEHGHCNLPSDNAKVEVKYRPLRSWLKKQRDAIKEYDEKQKEREELSQTYTTEDEEEEVAAAAAHGYFQITTKQRQLLLDVGVLVKSQKSKECSQIQYEEKFQKILGELIKFKTKNGHSNVPRDTKLGYWLHSIRTQYDEMNEGKETFLTMDHVVALASLGFNLAAPVRRRKTMENRIGEYVGFVREHGRHPSGHTDDTYERCLGKFAVNLRKKRQLSLKGIKRSKYGPTDFSQKLINLLDSVNFHWGNVKAPVIPWETFFERLVQFKAQHGHCNPPKQYPNGVGEWMRRQKGDYLKMVKGKSSPMTMERFRKLTELGVVFDVPVSSAANTAAATTTATAATGTTPLPVTAAASTALLPVIATTATTTTTSDDGNNSNNGDDDDDDIVDGDGDDSDESLGEA